MKLTDIRKNEQKKKIMATYNLQTDEEFKQFYDDLNSLVKEILEYIKPYKETIEFLRDKQYAMLLATISYKLIDNFSFLYFGNSNAENFKKLCEKYIVSSINSTVTPDELWENRNGIFHNGTYESNKVGQKKVKSLYHTIGNIQNTDKYHTIKKIQPNSEALDVHELSGKSLTIIHSILLDKLFNGCLENLRDNFNCMPYKTVDFKRRDIK